MKIAIISDIHANLEALNAFPETYDELWVLGDLVNRGPDPIEAIEWVREHASETIRGNHDHAIGFGTRRHRFGRFYQMRKYTERVLGAKEKKFLRNLPDHIGRQIGNTIFFLCHATPSNPLFEYRKADSAKWQMENAAGDASVVLVGHTHVPFVRHFGDRTIVNPGSLGQSKAGTPSARYAVWKDGRIDLKSFDFPVETTIAKIEQLPIDREVKCHLAAILRSGGAPSRS